jgi:pSer/pThr/pTyr-binding forkhead associated (FHA) protein
MAQLLLEVVEGQRVGGQFPLVGTLEVGREAGAALTLDDEQVSRRHARFSASGEGAIVEDLGSTNGTYVNGQPIYGSRELKPGDQVRFGVTVVELRTREAVATRPSAARQVPEVTALSRDVLAPVRAEELPSPVAASRGVPSFLVEETEPAFVPTAAISEREKGSDYAALASLVDAHVKYRTNVAGFAVLSVAGLAVLIFFGVK